MLQFFDEPVCQFEFRIRYNLFLQLVRFIWGLCQAKFFVQVLMVPLVGFLWFGVLVLIDVSESP